LPLVAGVRSRQGDRHENDAGCGYADLPSDHLSDPFVLVHVDRFGRVRDDHHGLLGIFDNVREYKNTTEE
jgi:hypothetical protein